MVWAGSDDGVVSVTQDAGKTWTNVTSKMSGVPKWTYVSDVLPSRAAAGTAYVTFDGHRGGDYNTYVFTTTDFGATWRSIVEQPAEGRGGPRRSPRIARTRTCSISAPRPACGCRWNRGGQWTRLKANLPTMPIYEIKHAPARQRHDPGHARARHLDPRRPRRRSSSGRSREAADALRCSSPSRRRPSTPPTIR